MHTYLLLHMVSHEPSHNPNKNITNKSTKRTGFLSQTIKKIMIAKCRAKVAKINGVLAPFDSTFPLMKLPKELPIPNTMMA